MKQPEFVSRLWYSTACGPGDNVAVTAAFITGVTVEPTLPPPGQSAGVSTSLWVTVINADILF